MKVILITQHSSEYYSNSEIEWSCNEKREPAISMPLDQKPAPATEQIIIFVVYTIGAYPCQATKVKPKKRIHRQEFSFCDEITQWIRQEMKWKKEKDANKSEVSTVFQIALKHNIPTSLEVKVGHEITTGTGPKKKIAKRNASEAMLLQLGYKPSSSTSRTARNVQLNILAAWIFGMSKKLCAGSLSTKEKVEQNLCGKWLNSLESVTYNILEEPLLLNSTEVIIAVKYDHTKANPQKDTFICRLVMPLQASITQGVMLCGPSSHISPLKKEQNK
ncbi:hypothetical protein L345_06449, partial [Ophiophagus hannah]